MAPPMGIEPTSPASSKRCSSIELRGIGEPGALSAATGTAPFILVGQPEAGKLLKLWNKLEM